AAGDYNPDMFDALPGFLRHQRIPVTATLCLLLAAIASPVDGMQRQTKDGSILSVEGPDGREYRVEEIGAKCVEFEIVKQGKGPFDYRECRVTESGEFGVVDGDRYYYATYCLMPNHADKESGCGDKSGTGFYHSHRATAIFMKERLSGNAKVVYRLVGAEIGLLHFRKKPLIVRHGGDTLLWLPVTQDGTGHYNDSRYYVWRAGRWERFDGTSWEADLGRRLPAGVETRKGTWPELQTMTAEVYLYRDGDSNASPTGGVARVRLRVGATGLEMESVEFEAAKE
ncbi:MAG TPA: hypothetical protein PKJ41_19080, partial [Bryobacteraceae bacterium]|nr:hypothetical protein [Bryobacteraceae bacterium]